MEYALEPIGRCIYCYINETETVLKKEHIVPYSLAGRTFLPKASCQKCESITSAIEGQCVNKMFKLLRLRLDIQSRKRKNRISSMKIPAIVDGKNVILNMPINGILGTFGSIHFKTPGFLRIPKEIPDTFVGCVFSINNVNPKDISLWEKMNVSSISSIISFDWESYALMMAKIAHCVAIEAFGIDNFDHVLTPFILNQTTEDLHYYLGGLKDIQPPKMNNRHHEIQYDIIKKDDDLYYISIKIRLFSFLGGPTTEVIAGFTDEERLNKIKMKLNNK